MKRESFAGRVPTGVVPICQNKTYSRKPQ